MVLPVVGGGHLKSLAFDNAWKIRAVRPFVVWLRWFRLNSFNFLQHCTLERRAPIAHRSIYTIGSISNWNATSGASPSNRGMLLSEKWLGCGGRHLGCVAGIPLELKGRNRGLGVLIQAWSAVGKGRKRCAWFNTSSSRIERMRLPLTRHWHDYSVWKSALSPAPISSECLAVILHAKQANAVTILHTTQNA